MKETEIKDNGNNNSQPLTLPCGCVPEDKEKAHWVTKDPNFFGPGTGLKIVQCNSCKRILGFTAFQSVSRSSLIVPGRE